MSFYVHPQGLCESTEVGTGTRIWAFAHVLPGAKIGRDCNVCDHVFIENRVSVGDRVTIKCGVQLWDGVRIEDDVFIGPNATFTNDKFPRSKVYQEQTIETIVGRGASIGANATILPGVMIGQNSMIAAGAVVTGSVPPNALVMGNPAQIVGYVDHDSKSRVASPRAVSAAPERSSQELAVKGVRLQRFPLIEDIRGNLTVGEMAHDLPFVPKRYFMVFDVPSKKVRGEHAHKKCHQFLICVKGTCSVMVDDGSAIEEVELNSPTVGIYVPPRVWSVQYKYSTDAVLLVFASESYDASDYIRDYNDFLSFIGKNSR